jgi:hypothetical protein
VGWWGGGRWWKEGCIARAKMRWKKEAAEVVARQREGARVG